MSQAGHKVSPVSRPPMVRVKFTLTKSFSQFYLYQSDFETIIKYFFKNDDIDRASPRVELFQPDIASPGSCNKSV